LFNKKKSVSSNRKIELTKFGINSGIVVTLFLIAPIIFTIIISPGTFNLTWNAGRGEFLFVMFFIAAELIGSKQKIDKKKLYIIIGLLSLTIGYFIAIEHKIPLGLKESIRAAAPIYNIQLIDSWIIMWDFVIMAVYVGLCLAIMYGKRWYKIAPAGLIFLAGTAVILSLDAFFPQDTLGPLQYVVPMFLQVDQEIIRFIDGFIMDLGPDSKLVTARDNTLTLNGSHGSLLLTVFWPSAGVHSMIIYSLLMLIFLLKMKIPVKRKLVYFFIGTLGTAIVNIIRIISLSLFALIVSADYMVWQPFHSIAGVMMFIPWLFIYVYSVFSLENRLAQKLHVLRV
jgi:thaumarchaeosortase